MTSRTIWFSFLRPFQHEFSNNVVFSFFFFICVWPPAVCVLLPTDWGYSGTLIHSGSWFAAATDLLVGSFPKSTSSIWMWVLSLDFFPLAAPPCGSLRLLVWLHKVMTGQTLTKHEWFFFFFFSFFNIWWRGAEAMPDWSAATGHGQRFGTSHRLGQRLRWRCPSTPVAGALRESLCQNAR